jgi:hypothetical protein
MVCEADRAKLRATLDDIVTLYIKLPAAIQPGSGNGPRVSGSRETPVPVRLDIIDLAAEARVPSLAKDARGLDWPEDQTGHLAVASILDSWVRDWIDTRNEREHAPAPTVSVLAGWLTVRLAWACDSHPAVDDFAREMRNLAGALRASVGETGDHKHIGHCPVIDPDDGSECGARLYASPWVDIIECPKCGARWPRERWFILGASIRQAS